MISEVEVLLLHCSLTKMGTVVWIDMACIQYIYISVLDILEYRHVSKIKH